MRPGSCHRRCPGAPRACAPHAPAAPPRGPRHRRRRAPASSACATRRGSTHPHPSRRRGAERCGVGREGWGGTQPAGSAAEHVCGRAQRQPARCPWSCLPTRLAPWLAAPRRVRWLCKALWSVTAGHGPHRRSRIPASSASARACAAETSSTKSLPHCPHCSAPSASCGRSAWHCGRRALLSARARGGLQDARGHRAAGGDAEAGGARSRRTW